MCDGSVSLRSFTVLVIIHPFLKKSRGYCIFIHRICKFYVCLLQKGLFRLVDCKQNYRRPRGLSPLRSPVPQGGHTRWRENRPSLLASLGFYLERFFTHQLSQAIPWNPVISLENAPFGESFVSAAWGRRRLKPAKKRRESLLLSLRLSSTWILCIVSSIYTALFSACSLPALSRSCSLR